MTSFPCWQNIESGRARCARPAVAIVFSALLAGMSAPDAGWAADWSLEPVVRLETAYDDNIRLEPDEEADGVTRGSLIIDTVLSGRSPTSEANVSLGLHFDRYSDETLDTDDQFLGVDLVKRTLLSEYALALQYDRDTTLTSEFDDSGLVRDGSRVERFGAEPSWTYQWTERTSIRPAYRYGESNFRDTADEELDDNRNQDLSVLLTHALSERTALLGQVALERFEVTEGDPATTDNVQATGGITYRASEVLTLTGTVGGRRTEFEETVGGITNRATDNGAVYELTAEWSWPRSSLSLEAGQSLEPSSISSSAEETRLGATYRYQMSERSEFRIAANAARRKYAPTADRAGDEQRDYYRVEVATDWQLSRVWVMSGGYRYRREENDPALDPSRDNIAESNSIFLTLSYALPRL